MKTGSFEGDDNCNDINSKMESRDFETQQVDSQYPGGDLEDDRTADFQYFTNTVPVDDSYLFEDACETHYLNIAGETQVVDLDDETQVVDDLDCMKNMPIEFLSDFYTENVAVSKCDTQVLSQDDDSGKINYRDLVGVDTTLDTCHHRQGLFSGGFTSIRAKSVRASGLAAHEHGANRNSGLTTSDKSSVELEQQTCKKSEQECLQNECIEQDTEDIRNSNKCEVDAAVSKLVKDAEIGQSETEINDPDDNLNIASENCFAGLSYVNSQEPGELSQAHALEVVDKFLDNITGFDECFRTVGKNSEKSKVVSGVKGSRELAKKASIVKKRDVDCGIYEWDDNREDDGGGDFFLKKKDLFFNNGCPKRRCLTEPRNPTGDAKKERKCSKNKLKGSAYSNSGLSREPRAKGKNSLNFGEALQKNLIKDLDEQAFEPNLVNNNDVIDDIGPDTQLAVEAMETLRFEAQLADDNGNDTDKTEATRKNQSSNKTARSEERLMTKSPNHSNAGVVTRQARQIKRARISGCDESSLYGQRSEKQRHLEDHLDFYVPVAHRTRKCTELKRSKATEIFDKREEINHAISARVTRDTDKAVGSNGPSASKIDAIDNNPREKRSRQENLTSSRYNNARLKKSRKVGANSSLGTRSGKIISRQNVDNGSSSRDATQKIGSGHVKVGTNVSEQRAKKGDSGKSSNIAKVDNRLEASPSSVCRTPVNKGSPICMGDEYQTQSCRKNLSRLSLVTEINNAVKGSPGSNSGTKESRKRKDITNIRVLFSQHLDEDVVKQQKKILAKLGGAVATSMCDATHFVADEFVRTSNMLEAIASGKPVVTHSWLEGCGQASCLMDEKNHILRDLKKEREFGFCLPVSLSRACQHPLLQGQKVFVTPNTKPGKVILANLVKTVHGLAIERVGRSVLNDEKLPDDLLILSCEEDYDICVPFLEKGGAVYSSELLLNGIVKQKLEFERHRLFDDHMKRTRSTIWMKKKNGYLPVTKCN